MINYFIIVNFVLMRRQNLELINFLLQVAGNNIFIKYPYSGIDKPNI